MQPFASLAGDATFIAGYTNLVDAWSNQTGIPVTLFWPDRMTYTTDDMSLFLEIIAQQKSRTWDVFSMDVIWPATFADRILLPLDRLVSPTVVAQCDPGALGPSIINGTLYSLPTCAEGGLLIYRSDILAKYGYHQPPKTWDEMEQMLSTILPGEQATNPSMAGFVSELRPYEGLTCNVAEWFAGANLTMFLDASSHLPLATPESQAQAAAVLSRFRRWIQQGLIPSAALRYAEYDADSKFHFGTTVFLRTWNSDSFGLASIPVNFTWDLAPLPGETADWIGASTLGGGVIGINRFSRNVTRAARVIEFLSGPEIQRQITTGFGMRPTIPALFNDPDVNRVYNAALLNATRIIDRPSSSSRGQYLAVSNLIYSRVNLVLAGFADALSTIAFLNTAIADLLGIDHFGAPQNVPWNTLPSIIAWVIISLLVIVILFLAALLFRQRDAASARRVPTEFLAGVLAGCFLGSLVPLTYIGTPTSTTCSMRMILMGLGFTIMTSCMAAQDFRVYLIVSSPLRRVAADVNRILWRSILAAWVLEGVLIGVWLSIDPFVPMDYKVDGSWRYTGCGCNDTLFQLIMFVAQCLVCGCLVAVCVWLAVRNRSVAPKTNTSGAAMSRAAYLMLIGASAAVR
ncbi:hypothetical protein AMAG_09478 [Allomyces macrogynus ATCC 38327]|uniref:G-protein coupled receptors family 3 profile domain-containing protein n=1 Tax=Allomyces macrogynus (strain ATCC 38327) TaxID=578462 RepID=A0A0L0SPR2_ALLM3|nr:hypothetical protein AMAG_09478 [Allomyces macrogynus ATCC 38327]|eukprot:KNE64457.1 hypothetical protein AMAG_09478 [Allomyces macrogynus ATCC 38327]